MNKLSARIYAQGKLLDIVQRRDRTAIVDALGVLAQEHCVDGIDALLDFVTELPLFDALFVHPHIGCNERVEWGIGELPEDHAWNEEMGCWLDAEGMPLPWKDR